MSMMIYKPIIRNMDQIEWVGQAVRRELHRER